MLLHHLAKHKLILFSISSIVLFRLFLFLLFPNPGVDGPLYLSHTFTILNGRLFQNDFMREYIPVFNFPYFFGLFNAPFYFFFKGTYLQKYSILLWDVVWLVLFVYSAYLLLKKQKYFLQKFCCISLAYLVSVYSASTRSEIFILPFCTLLIHCCDQSFVEKRKLFSFIYTPFLITVIGLMHPVAGLFACAFLLVFAISKKVLLSKLIVCFGITGLLVCIFYLPAILINVTAWKRHFITTGFVQRNHSFTDLSPFFKYVFYNPTVIVSIVILFFNANNILKELIIWLIPFFTLCYFHQSYYYHYLFAVILWRMIEIEEINNLPLLRWVFGCTVLYGFVFGYLFPLAQLLENYSYPKTYNATLNYLYTSKQKDRNKKVWVSAEMSMPVIDEPNTRVLVYDIKETGIRIAPVDTTSIFYITQVSQLNEIKQYPLCNKCLIRTSTIIRPVRGLFTISKDFKRSEPIGLWKVEIVNK